MCSTAQKKLLVLLRSWEFEQIIEQKTKEKFRYS